ncbi:Mitochondrial inner membrane protein OXA1 [Phlyctema vagabunda]|uniref:Mitochondrial inner membrane protein OXA1 n=1 Tax=Phlyctema vagabunda TaxID=108571 RepID=A0ABR4PJ33_9HELO
MLPSRGARCLSQTIGVGRRRIESLTARKFSSSPSSFRSTPLLSGGASIPRISSLSRSSRSSILIRNGAAVRFASTTPVSTTAAPATTSEAATEAVASSATTPTTFDQVIDLSTNGLLRDVPEHLGYLKSMGLDYGWGPTAFVEWTLEHVHVLAGTPWWASIILTAVLVRAALLKPYMDATDNASKLATIQHITKPISEKMQAASKAGDTTKTMALRRELQIVHKRAGIKMWKSLVPMSQAFIGFGTFKLMRAMGNLPVPGWETGGMLWFQNLTLPDPTYVLPVVTAGMLHILLKKGGETGVNLLSPSAQKLMMYGIPGVTLAFTSFLPAGLQLSFFVTGLLSYIQASVFRNPKVRAALGMTPLPSTNASGPLQPTLNVRTAIPVDAVEVRQNAGAVKEVMSTYQGARKAVQDVTGTGKEKVQERRQKSAREAAQKFEEQRQKEIREARWEREDAKRREGG